MLDDMRSDDKLEPQVADHIGVRLAGPFEVNVGESRGRVCGQLVILDELIARPYVNVKSSWPLRQEWGVQRRHFQGSVSILEPTAHEVLPPGFKVDASARAVHGSLDVFVDIANAFHVYGVERAGCQQLLERRSVG